MLEPKEIYFKTMRGKIKGVKTKAKCVGKFANTIYKLNNMLEEDIIRNIHPTQLFIYCNRRF